MKFLLSLLLVFVQLNFFAQNFNVVDVKKLGVEVNETAAEESIPLVSTGLGKLFFVRTAFNDNNELVDQSIFESNIDGSYNASAANESKTLNNKRNNAILGLNKDGTKVYMLDGYSRELTAGIVVSTNQGGKWTKPEKVDIPNLLAPNSMFGFHISVDEKVIIMSYYDPSGLGQEDLFVTTFSNGAWTTPKHMGNKVNSSGFEISPYLSPTMDTMFFSSDGFKGLGDADIYYSIKGSSWTDWSTPVNLGAPVNSEKFDAYFTYSKDRVFWSSNRGQKYSDIYTAKRKPLPPLTMDIMATDCSKFNENDGKSSVTIAGGAAPYSVMWMDGNTEMERNNLKPGEYSVIVTDKNGTQVTKKATIAQPKREIKALAFQHFFDYNTYEISEDETLKKLLEDLSAMSIDAPVSIKIISSASNVPTRKHGSNEKLAEKRAKELRKFIEKTNKNILITVESFVGGPEYNEDPSDLDKYRQHQYVKIVVI